MAATGQKLSTVEEAVRLWEKGLKVAIKAVKTDKATNNGRSISPGRARAERAKNNTAENGGGKYSIDFQNATENTSIMELIEKVNSGVFSQNETVYLGSVSAKAAADIRTITGIDVTGYKVAIEARMIDHILKRHGEYGVADHSMADPADLAKLNYVLNNYDEIVSGENTTAYTSRVDNRNKSSKTVVYSKNISGSTKSYYVAQAVPVTKSRTLYILSAFIGNSKTKKEALQSPNAVRPGATAKTESASASNMSISTDGTNVNPKFSIDLDYMGAVNHGDMEAAQKMVDEAAKQAGYTIHAYHGTPNGNFTVFRNWQYFTQNKAYADVYQNQGASSNGYKTTATNPKTYEVYLAPKKILM